MWRYLNLYNFEHSYKLFTPIKLYEENGVVARLILDDGLNTEFSGKFASSKVYLLIKTLNVS